MIRNTFLIAVSVLLAGAPLFAAEAESQPVKLTVQEDHITVKGRDVPVMAIKQDDGQSGYSPEKADNFHVEVANQLKVPTTIHWHGLVLPNLMDGVPFVTQNPIPPGGKFDYQFPLKQSGTYWMHSHYGLQEQLLNAAPLVVWTPEERAKADVQYVVALSDFSFTSPSDILKKLKAGMPGPKDAKKMPAATPAAGMEMGAKETLYAQKWDPEAKRFTRVEVSDVKPDIDVQYDALLANRRTVDNPETLAVKPGQTVLLRLIAASSATDFFVDTGGLEAELLAVDGQPVESLKGNYFQLAVAQRIDLRVTIPEAGGAFPVYFQGEGTKLLAAVVLATEGAAMPDLTKEAALLTASLDNTQEKELRAVHPLAEKVADRSYAAVLGGNMADYVWTINGSAYPNRKSLDVKTGERVEIVLTNITSMGHPMHLHGHDFQVLEIDGEKLDGAMRDTVEVPPKSTMTIAFDANNPGIWAFHCHILYHLATGMFTVVKYDGADEKYWQPEKTFTELQNR